MKKLLVVIFFLTLFMVAHAARKQTHIKTDLFVREHTIKI